MINIKFCGVFLNEKPSISYGFKDGENFCLENCQRLGDLNTTIGLIKKFDVKSEILISNDTGIDVSEILKSIDGLKEMKINYLEMNKIDTNKSVNNFNQIIMTDKMRKTIAEYLLTASETNTLQNTNLLSFHLFANVCYRYKFYGMFGH